MDAADAPQEVTIDGLSQLYGPVAFDHAMHTEIARCADCHHHTTGAGITNPNCVRCHAVSPETDDVSCSGCHEADRFNAAYLKKLDDPKLYHIDKPGLKAAYHLNCVGCHQTVGGPVGCQDCHTMTDAGEQMFKAGKHAPTGTGQVGGHE
jgi:hypothetical protein